MTGTFAETNRIALYPRPTTGKRRPTRSARDTARAMSQEDVESVKEPFDRFNRLATAGLSE
jgi:hypothetical protein